MATGGDKSNYMSKQKNPPHHAGTVREQVKQGGRGLVSVRVTLQDEARITGYIVTGCKI